ncbi:MAG: hypothetical protein JXR83_01740 [Deltaproteobacteria bacterium]|nr:hypothetical protein [Deltaproteobacteria bacterium]
MAPDKPTLRRVAAGIRDDMANVSRILAVIDGCGPRFAARAPDPIELHGVAGYLHDFYCAVENALARVVPVLNGAIPAGAAWHRELLQVVILDLPGVRPPVLSRGAARGLDEFMRFRHRYRQMYAYDLEWQPVAALVAGARQAWEPVRFDLEKFLAFLDAAAEVVDQEE